MGESLGKVNSRAGRVGVIFVMLIVLGVALPYIFLPVAPEPAPTVVVRVELPEPRHDSDVSIEQALLLRRSIRDYTEEPLTLQEVSQLAWAGQGITDPRGFRTAPSAGGTYPLELYVVVGDVVGLDKGVYHYDPEEHALTMVLGGDKRAELSDAAVRQEWVREAAINIVIAAVYERTTGRYGERGIRYVHMEAGHASQNLYLQAPALGLGTVTIGAFDDERVKTLLGMRADEQPLYIMPVGRKT